MTKAVLRIVSFAFVLTNFMAGLDTSIINTALPKIVSDFHASDQIGLITGMYLFGVACSTVVWGKLAEKYGSKRAFLAATSLFTAASLMGGLVNTVDLVILSRLLMGIGGGGMMALPFIIYVDLYPNPSDRARINGVIASVYAFSTMVGPLIGGWLVDYLSWHWVFLVNVPVGVLCIILTTGYYQPKTVAKNISHKLDYVGVIVMICLIATLVYLLQSVGSLSAIAIIVLLVVVIVLLILFILIERRAQMPLIPLELFSNHAYMGQTTAEVLILCMTFAYGVYAPMWAQNVLGTSASLGGGTQLASSIAMILITRIGSGLYDKLTPFKQSTIGFVFLLCSAVLLSAADVGKSYWYIVVSGALQGIGMGLTFPLLSVTFQESVDKRLVGDATTLNMLLRTIGQTLVASVYGLIYNFVIKQSVRGTNGAVSIQMMNRISDKTFLNSITSKLDLLLRHIEFNGIHAVFVLVLGWAVLALVVNTLTWQHIAKSLVTKKT
ncbi:MFS transporter [Secundilactobacillus folii]|uniref:MFS transporter n=1 Tax=Secundilactobacillus folii TaxID=2678357 RepID=A0A7X2XW14_9LACO|nr:MFS transporter [Secundilactobacillus folii]MTV81928.1 MFS transporter [Secundilactobacillus folii]